MNGVVTCRVELANRIEHGRVVGNLFGVAELVDGCRRGGWVLAPQSSEDVARNFAATRTDHLARNAAEDRVRATGRCCELCAVRLCVCERATHCPVHGDFCIGSHD